MLKKISTLLIAACCCHNGFAQTKKVSTDEAFAPLVYPSGSNVRTADGKPGAEYWQNRADYHVEVSLDTLTRNISGKTNITYTNNSPVTLTYVWLMASQNRFRSDSRTAVLTPPQGSRFGVQEFTNGFRIHELQAAIGRQPLKKAAYDVTDTYVKVMLPAPLKSGDKAVIAVEYDFTLPFNGSDYLGILSAAHGKVFQLAGVFPRVAVYDDVHGWNVFNSAYYVEPGTMDLSITLPAGLTVAGTGELMNPEAVLPADVFKRYQQAWKSDTVVHLITAAAAEKVTAVPGQKTWRFHLDNAGDGMWGASAAFVWDAVKVNLPAGKQMLAMALYPPDSNPEWYVIANEMKRMVTAYSSLWATYPYPTWVNIGGSVTGIASPAVSIIHYKNSGFGSSIWTKSNHELGHTWFNMLIAADSRHGWMCEGLNTFINLINCDSLKGEGAFQMENAITWLSASKSMQPLNTPAASVLTENMAMIMYVKPAVALSLLRNEVIGPERFDPVFRAFINDWSFKHPTPDDFFRAIENGTGEDLSWFWRSWFLTDWKSDQAVKQVVYVNNDPSKGVDITVENIGDMLMPVNVLIREFNGDAHTLHFPAQIWQLGRTHTFHYASVSPVTAVIIDPLKVIPDTDRSNNECKGTGVKLSIGKDVSVSSVIARYLLAIGGEERLRQIQTATLSYTSPVTGQYVFVKNSTAAQQQMTISLTNLNLQLRGVMVIDSNVNSQRLNEAVALDASQQDNLRISAAVFPETHFFEKKYHTVLCDSTIHVNGMNAYVVNVTTPAGAAWNYYYDINTGYKILEECAGSPAKCPFYTKLEFSAYQQQDGITLPHQQIIHFYDETEESLVLNKCELDH
ncbi:M1 family metallopeptidase [Chitinophaga sp.]|uniref:M1 family metallopeptidase n=1 Tax=Chitinophaga sp. TaxID=1869181 RepID=UPI002F94F1D9